MARVATKGAVMERIVVGIDGSDASRRALNWALDEARRRQCSVDAVHAWEPPYLVAYPYAGGQYDPVTYEQAAKDTLDRVVDAVDASGLAVPVSRILRLGHPAETILDEAKGADLVVVGSRGLGGFRGLLLGSVSQQVAHHAPCPVVIVPAED